MAKKLKCLIFGDRDVIKKDNGIFPNVKRLINYLIKRKIQPVILSNDQTIERLRLEKELQSEYPNVAWFIADRDETPKKPKPESIQWVLDSFKIEPHEAMMIGNSDNDMKTAVNSGLLFANASWYGKKTNYGFEFKQPYEIARFVHIFCLREIFWGYAIKNEGLEYYSLGIYGTREEKYDYSHDAKEAAKLGRGHPNFWINYLLSSVYFSGLHKKIDYIAPYPGHKQESTPTVMEKTIVTFAKCFRKKYLKDLIIRHETANKSAYARSSGKGGALDHLNQLNTIKLNPFPLKKEKERYKRSPLKSGKTVLVIDDFCTEGYSLEAARAYIEQTGANVICLSLLKTIFRGYKQIQNISKFSPFDPQEFSSSDIQATQHEYQKYISSPPSEYEIRKKLAEYDQWEEKYSES